MVLNSCTLTTPTIVLQHHVRRYRNETMNLKRNVIGVTNGIITFLFSFIDSNVYAYFFSSVYWSQTTSLFPLTILN